MKELGYQTWFDKEQMADDTDLLMFQGTEKKSMFVFITKWYHHQVKRGNANDNCRQEFIYPARMKTIAYMEV